MTSYLDRSKAFLIDYLVALAPFWMAFPLIAAYSVSDSAVNELISWSLLFIFILASPIFYFFMNSVLVLQNIQSPGRRVAGIILVDSEDEPVIGWSGFKKVLLRQIFLPFALVALYFNTFPILLLYPAFAIWRTDKKSISDLVSGTHFIKKD